MKKPSLILLATFSVGFAANNTLNALVSAEGMSAASVHNVSKNSDSSSKSAKDDKEEIKYNKSTKDFVKVLLTTMVPLCAFTSSSIAIVNKQLELKSEETSEKSSEEKQQEVDKEEESEDNKKVDKKQKSEDNKEVNKEQKNRDNKEIVQKSNKKENNVIKKIIAVTLLVISIPIIYIIYYRSLKKKLKNKLLEYEDEKFEDEESGVNEYGVKEYGVKEYGVKESEDEESGIDLLFEYLDIIFGYIGSIPSLRILLKFDKLISLLEREAGVANFPKFFNNLDRYGIVNFAEILDNLEDKGIANFATILSELNGNGSANFAEILNGINKNSCGNLITLINGNYAAKFIEFLNKSKKIDDLLVFFNSDNFDPENFAKKIEEVVIKLVEQGKCDNKDNSAENVSYKDFTGGLKNNDNFFSEDENYLDEQVENDDLYQNNKEKDFSKLSINDSLLAALSSKFSGN